MHFLPDIYVPCDVCKSQRYNRETLEIRYKGKNIKEVQKERAGIAGPFWMFAGEERGRSGGLLDLSRTQATGAHLYPAGAAVHFGPHFLQVGVEDAFGLVVGVADVIAAHHALAG